MSDASTSQERTEKATPEHLKRAREKGQLGTSHDLTAWVSVGAAALAIPAAYDVTGRALASGIGAIGDVVADPEQADALQVLERGLGVLGPALLPMLAAVAVGVVAAAAVQGGIHLKRMTPRADQLDLVQGVKRVFGARALWEGVKALLKTAVVGLVLVVVLQGLMPVLSSGGGLPVGAVLEAAAAGAVGLLQAGVVAGLALAAVDVLVVVRRNRRHTRMTRKELTDEAKRTEGDPLIRAQRRSRQLALSRNRMMAAVADADVVLLNPTHLAVALRYEPGKSAPRVVAKGADLVALRIRERATEAGVPMVQDVALARAVHAACEVGHEIPVELYTAVARVLAFVMSLRRRGVAQGTRTFDAMAG